jgi:hypothetical protein
MFDKIPLKINMGTYDEYGSECSQEEIIANKSPANFSLDFPTSVSYLDAIFTVNLKSGESLINKNNYLNGLNKPLNEIDENVRKDWLSKYNHNKWQHINTMKDLSSYTDQMRYNFSHSPLNYNAFPVLFSKKIQTKSMYNNTINFFSKNKKLIAGFTVGVLSGTALSRYYKS